MDDSSKDVRITTNSGLVNLQGLYFLHMRYYTEKPKGAVSTRRYTYKHNHALYHECTILRKNDVGLAIVQMRFNTKLKIFWYGPVDSWLTDKIVSQQGFELYFSEHAEKPSDGLYPTVTVRQIMWALRMKPLKKYEWESQLLQLL